MPKNPDIAKNQDLSIQDLRVIIHGLKMAGFAFVESEAIDGIRFRIKGLPGPEELNDLFGDPNSLKSLAKEVGEIMKLVEIYGKKGPEFKARFESLKGMPPRYKVLEWRKANMKNTDFVRQAINLSAIVDEKGQSDIASKLNALAKNVLEQRETEEEIIDVISALSNVKMVKEAQGIRDWWNNRKTRKRNTKQEAADLKTLTQIQNGIWQARQQLQNGIGSFRSQIEGVNKLVDQLHEPNRKAKAKAIANQFNINIEGDEEVFGDTSKNEAVLKQMIEELKSLTYMNRASPEDAAPESTPATPATPATPVSPASPAAPAGVPPVSSPDVAARFVDFMKKSLIPMASKKSSKIIVAQASTEEDQAFRLWWDKNKNNPEAVNLALNYYQSVAGTTTSPRGVSETNLLSSDVGKSAPAAPPAAPTAAPAAAPISGPSTSVPAGTEESYAFLNQIGVSGLEPIPNAENQYKGKDGKVWSIVPAKTASTKIRMIRIV